MVKKDLKEIIPLPEGVSLQKNEKGIVLKGPKGEVERKHNDAIISVRTENNSILLEAKKATRREKTKLFTLRAHLRNMIKGVTQGHFYKLKICSGHFPMNVALSGNKLSVKNFLGEKIPRELEIPAGVTVKVDGEQVSVESASKELAGQTAANMEQLTRVTTRDLRIFQDGFYIIEKDGKVMN